ncbi:heme lyase CcmF/NrfE family subunit [Pontibacterium granulatum]|uniref:heme lyase CcmF/NrfE family subunit n=1 Tax=Pontibacterium granulatum TaxID=2036029 RepID=UPI00249C970D|nr:heme lyase CcmF/NrfE family subunit [Pontibacterium granulatum]MDI3322855.1 heme lyase CcmF/NrfE family subunit [Pontibacterium granulatum]
MIPELGQYALILALCLAALLSVVPLVGASTGNQLWMGYARPLSKGMCLFLVISIFCLGYAFVVDDFSVAYVAANSNTALPVYYKISAIWGGHEGSLLLWVVILGGWIYAVAVKSRNLPQDIVARVLSVMGIIAVGFILFTLLTSSPFERHLPMYPQEGGDLNPLLQDIGLIIHPPMLYMGYVGFSVAFAFAIAALMSGQLDAAWARWSRPWTNIAWAFLTLGIALGSWWAYYELGWGGWWFWDPVENASFMPWLVGTALIHSLAVTEKRGVFKSWTVLLAIFAFSLSLLGTFLVRSGVLTSVHAFASDPERGYFILALLAITIGGSLLLYAIKAAHVKAESSFELISRESFLLLNNIVLVVVAFMVLLGTLYPLLLDALQMGKISVGAPYFNAMFIPLMSVLVVLMGIGAIARWKVTKGEFLIKQLWLPGALALVAGVLISLFGGIDYDWRAMGSLILCFWIVFSGIRDMYNRVSHKASPIKALGNFSLSYYGMVLAHVGVAVCIVGITMVSLYSEERDMRMAPGDRLAFKHYEFVFEGSRRVTGPNYSSDMGRIVVLKDGEPYSLMNPEKRLYNARGNMMTEAAIDPGLFRDLYVALGEPLEGGAWAVRMQYKPFVRWIWLGGLMMTFGGMLAAADKRYRKQAKRRQSKPVATEPEFA